MTEAMSEEHLAAIREWSHATSSEALELCDEIARLRSQLAKSESLCKLRGKRLIELQTLPAAKEALDALDELVKLVIHDAECMADNGEPEMCDGTCRATLAEDKLEALINRLAAGNAERLAVAEAVCEALFAIDTKHPIPPWLDAAWNLMMKQQSLRGGGDDVPR